MARGQKVLKARAAIKKFTIKYESTKAVAGAAGKYYPAEDLVANKGPTPVRNAPKTRASITPGTVVILLAGRFRGKRCVVLKSLASGLLLVSGPFAVNGVPLRRISQKYVIATSTKVGMSGVDASKVDDAFFARQKNEVAGSTSDARKAAQKTIDAALTKNIGGTDLCKEYLQSKFSLKNNERPHLMKF
jgi:large subunit ribosomal protein L6e